MKSYLAWSVCVLLLAAGNFGCYYDQWQAAERDNRVLREDLARAKQDLQDAELMLRQKDTTIESLNNQLAAKDQTIANLTAENQNLRDAMGRATGLLEKNLAAVPDVKIISQALPQPLHEALKKLAEEYPDLMEYLPEKGAVRWKADLLFPLGSDEMNEMNAKVGEALKKFAEIVMSDKATGFDVIVVGHTCNTPIRRSDTLAKHPTNWHLSAHRAIAVMNLLAGQGIGMNRMGVMGYGEHRPIADNSSQEGKAKNRRVEIFLVPKEKVQSVSMDVLQVKDRALTFVPATAGLETGS